MPLNRRVGERLADIGLHNDVDLEQAGDRAGDRVQLIAGELPARDVGRAIDDVLGLAATGDAHRVAIRLNLGQIVVDVAGQHRIAADGNRAFLKRPQRKVARRRQEPFGHRDVEVRRHAIDLAGDPDFLPAFIPLAVDGQREGFVRVRRRSVS